MARKTVEALAPLLLENPRGLLLARDELSGWIGSLDRYGSGPGSDAAHWLGMHSGEPILVDRKTGQPRTIYVPRAAMCITGGIQPGVLHRALGTAHRESGLAARLLLACPPRQPKRWTEAGVDPQLEAKVAAVLDRLYDLQPAADDHGEPCPLTLTLTPAARRLWIEFYNAHAREQAALSGELASVWSKLEEYAARLALVVHAARCAAADPALESEAQVDAQSLTAGVTLARWFGHEARRVYRRLGDGDSGRDGDPGRPQRELLELIARRGGRITPRELAQTRRGYQPASVAEAALHALVGAGLGHWEFVKTASKPRRDFVLATPPAPTNPSETREIDRNGDVDVWTEFSAVGKPAFPIASPEIRSLRGREDSPVGRDGVVPIEVGWSLVPASQKSG